MRISTGSMSAGSATSKVRPTTLIGARLKPRAISALRKRASTASSTASTTPGRMPPVNSAAIEMPATEPMVISTSEGGIVSAIAPEAASSEISSPSLLPRRFISGSSTGATAAMSAVFAPEMPDTSSIALSST